MIETKNYSRTSELTFNEYLGSVFSFLSIGLAISAVVSFVFAYFIDSIIGIIGGVYVILMLACCIAEIIVAMRLSAKLMELSKSQCWRLYFAYAILTGLSLASVIYSYASSSIWLAFGITTIMFGVMAIIANRTNVDLSKFSSIIFVGLMTIIVVSLLNVFVFKNVMVDWLLCYVGIIIFLIIIAMDIQKLRIYYDTYINGMDADNKLMIMGAFQLYLDFINLFLRIIRLLGRRKD